MSTSPTSLFFTVPEAPTAQYWALVVLITLVALRASCALWLRARIAPGPPRLPIFGSLPWLSRHRHLLDQAPRWRDQHGGIVQVGIGMSDVLLITRVRDARRLLYGTITEGRPKLVFFHDDMNPARWLGPVVQANAWIHATRRTTAKLSKALGTAAGEHATNLMLDWVDRHHDGPCHLEDLLRHFSVANAVEAAWGVRADSIEELEDLQDLQSFMDLGRQMMLCYDASQDATVPFPFLKSLMPWRIAKGRKRARAIYKHWEDTAKSLATNLRERFKIMKDCQTAIAKHEKQYQMEQDEIDLQGALILNGTLDTMYHTSMLTVACLTYFQNTQRSIRAELEAWTAANKPLCTSPKLVAFIRETLRLYPFAAVGFPRSTDDAMPLSDESSSRSIPPGTTLIPLTMTLGRDKEYWGENAEEHDYRRFLSEDEELSPLPFPVFGFGFGE